MAALMETAPSSGERTELSEPIIPPIGVRAEPAITMSLFMDFVLLQQNRVGVLIWPYSLVWAPSLLVMRAGTRGGCWIFCRKKMSERSELFFQKNPTATPQARPHNRKAWS